jgi:hypothetical protein
MLNPGQGGTRQLASNDQLNDLLSLYQSGSKTLTDLFQYQESHMQSWGRPEGHFLNFYATSLGLSIESLSFINIALCATKGNKYPGVMLNQCFNKYTAPLTSALQPDIILLSGTSTYAFESRLKSLLPKALIIRMLHYAHREGKEREAEELARVKTVIAGGY